MQPKKQLKVQYIGIFEEIDSFFYQKTLLEKGPKIRAWVDPPPPPPSFGQCLKENIFFLGRCSLNSFVRIQIKDVTTFHLQKEAENLKLSGN